MLYIFNHIGILSFSKLSSCQDIMQNVCASIFHVEFYVFRTFNSNNNEIYLCTLCNSTSYPSIEMGGGTFNKCLVRSRFRTQYPVQKAKSEQQTWSNGRTLPNEKRFIFSSKGKFYPLTRGGLISVRRVRAHHLSGDQATRNRSALFATRFTSAASVSRSSMNLWRPQLSALKMS